MKQQILIIVTLVTCTSLHSMQGLRRLALKPSSFTKTIVAACSAQSDARQTSRLYRRYGNRNYAPILPQEVLTFSEVKETFTQKELEELKARVPYKVNILTPEEYEYYKTIDQRLAYVSTGFVYAGALFYGILVTDFLIRR